MEKTKKTKSRKMIILLSIIGVIVVFITTVLLTVLYVQSPTKGPAIIEYANPNSVLLVIDVQNDITNNTEAYSNTTEFVEKVNQAVAVAEKIGMEIVYVKNEYGSNPIILLLSGGKFKKGTHGVEFDGNLHIVNNNIFTKSIGDSFSSKEFDEYLTSHNADTLYIVGADAAACVYSTAKGGLNRNYNVSVIKDAIITRSDDIMKQMLEQYEKDGIGILDVTNFEKLMYE